MMTVKLKLYGDSHTGRTQIVSSSGLTKKEQLKVAIKQTLVKMVDELNNNCSYAGSDVEAATIEKNANLLLKEVTIRTVLK